MELQGQITKIGITKTFGSKGFKKRNLILTTDEQYPQPILIEFVQDKCELLDKFKEGQDVTISINLNGREWTNPEGEVKYFNSIQGWKIEPKKEDAKQTDVEFEEIGGEVDGIPF